MRTRLLVSMWALTLAATACVGSAAEPKTMTETDRDAVTTATVDDPTTTTVPPDGPLMARPDATGDELLRNLAYPAFDITGWFARTGYTDPEAAIVPDPLAQVGDTETFHLSDGFEITSIRATLAYANEAATFWVQDGVDLLTRDLRVAADEFARDVIPAVTEVFGDIPDPGIDGDPRLAVLHVDDLVGSIGEFVSYDLLPASEFEGSNEREMLYVSATGLEVGSDAYMATLAHELQHLLDYTGKENTPLWMAEGMAQVAERIAGYDQVISDDDYLSVNAVALNDWSAAQLDDRHYGASYLFFVYLYERWGAEAMRALMESELSGMAAVDGLARRNGTDLEELVGDWITAIALDDPSIGDGRFGFLADTVGRACPLNRPETAPHRVSGVIPQFAPRYFGVEGSGPLQVSFAGAAQVGVIDDLPFRGEHLWWSGRADNSASSMTRAFDLSGLRSATLEYRIWYDTGYDDGATVQVSTDGGATWHVLEGRRAGEITLGTDHVIPAYTGTSGNGATPSWVRDEVDLTPYAGGEVLIRFEYATDLYEGRLGLAIDNVEIAELGYLDGAEDPGGWMLDGFIRTDNRFSQPWVLRLIQPGAPEPVVDVPVDAGRATATVDGDLGPATVAIVAAAPGVGTKAEYTVEIDGDLVTAAGTDGRLHDFSDPCGGWELEDTDAYAITLQDDRLVLTVYEPDVFTWSSVAGYHEDTSVTATATFETGEESLAGIMCRTNPLGFYDFEVSSDGYFFAGVAYEEGYEVLHDWSPSPAIATGHGAVNDLRLDCIGERLTFIVNGTELISLTDDRIRAGSIAMAAGTFLELTDDAVVGFDDVEIVGAALADLPDVISHQPFESTGDGWDEVTTARGAATVEDGAYRFDVRSADWGVEGYLDLPFRDQIVDAEIRFDAVPPDAILGLACRTDENGDQYLFMVSGDGYYNISAYWKGRFEDIVGWSPLFVLDLQPGATNHLHAECVGERLVFEVNGLVVAEAIDDRIAEGDLGFVGYTFERGGLRFDVLDLVVRRP